MWCEGCRYVADGAGRAAEEVKQREKARKHVNLEVKAPGFQHGEHCRIIKLVDFPHFFPQLWKTSKGSRAPLPQGGDFNTGVVSIAMRPSGAGERRGTAANRGDSWAKSRAS